MSISSAKLRNPVALIGARAAVAKLRGFGGNSYIKCPKVDLEIEHN